MSSPKKVVTISGKRKTATARATLRMGKGRIRINNVPLEIFEPRTSRMKIMEPLFQVDSELRNQVDINIKIVGGGFMGQAEAARMALAKGLVRWTRSKHLQSAFTDYDRTMLAGDPRRKESKKFGGPGARARDQKSYR
jgi:small subunit ribosomal protein S9